MGTWATELSSLIFFRLLYFTAFFDVISVLELTWLRKCKCAERFFARKCLGFEDQKGLGNLCETGVQLIWPKQLADAVGKIPCFALHTCPWSQEFFTPESAGLKGGVFVCRLCLHIISWKASSKKDWLWALHGSYMLAFAVSILMLYSSKPLGSFLSWWTPGFQSVKLCRWYPLIDVTHSGQRSLGIFTAHLCFICFFAKLVVRSFEHLMFKNYGGYIWAWYFFRCASEVGIAAWCLAICNSTDSTE